MTSNREKAAEVIWDEQAAGIAKPSDLAQALAETGLLAPDALPPRYLFDDWGVWPINEHPSDYVEMRITGTGRRLIDMHAPLQMGPATARRLAAALIAAADHAETEVTDAWHDSE